MKNQSINNQLDYCGINQTDNPLISAAIITFASL
jgi:hypothetical protein